LSTKKPEIINLKFDDLRNNPKRLCPLEKEGVYVFVNVKHFINIDVENGRRVVAAATEECGSGGRRSGDAALWEKEI
jgi:hypothetical protein